MRPLLGRGLEGPQSGYLGGASRRTSGLVVWARGLRSTSSTAEASMRSSAHESESERARPNSCSTSTRERRIVTVDSFLG